MAPWMTIIGPRFRPERLLPDLDCYSWLPGKTKMVIVQSRGEMVLVFLRGEDQLICDCSEYRFREDCRHTRALRAGLWAYIFSCPQGYGLVTCTRDWVQKGQSSSAMPVLLNRDISVAA